MSRVWSLSCPSVMPITTSCCTAPSMSKVMELWQSPCIRHRGTRVALMLRGQGESCHAWGRDLGHTRIHGSSHQGCIHVAWLRSARKHQWPVSMTSPAGITASIQSCRVATNVPARLHTCPYALPCWTLPGVSLFTAPGETISPGICSQAPAPRLAHSFGTDVSRHTPCTCLCYHV